jgi:hypothetical protein
MQIVDKEKKIDIEMAKSFAAHLYPYTHNICHIASGIFGIHADQTREEELESLARLKDQDIISEYHLVEGFMYPDYTEHQDKGIKFSDTISFTKIFDSLRPVDWKEKIGDLDKGYVKMMEPYFEFTINLPKLFAYLDENKVVYLFDGNWKNANQ